MDDGVCLWFKKDKNMKIRIPFQLLLYFFFFPQITTTPSYNILLSNICVHMNNDCWFSEVLDHNYKNEKNEK